jgi:hypothetical protein
LLYPKYLFIYLKPSFDGLKISSPCLRFRKRDRDKLMHHLPVEIPVINAAKGAALGTETTMDYEIIGGTHDLLINRTLAKAMYENLETVGGVVYGKDDILFGEQIQSTFNDVRSPITSANSIVPLRSDVNVWPASTDVGMSVMLLQRLGYTRRHGFLEQPHIAGRQLPVELRRSE